MSQTQKGSSLRPLSSYEDYTYQNEYISKENNIQEEFETIINYIFIIVIFI